MRPRHKKDVAPLLSNVLKGDLFGTYLGFNEIEDDVRHCIAFALETERGKDFGAMRFQYNKDFIRKHWPEFIGTHRFFFFTEEQFSTDNCVFALYDEKPLKELLWDMEGETLQ